MSKPLKVFLFVCIVISLVIGLLVGAFNHSRAKDTAIINSLTASSTSEAVDTDSFVFWAKDMCEYRQHFKICLDSIPAGPTSVVSNDWAEVIESCSEAANKAANKLKKFIPAECISPRTY